MKTKESQAESIRQGFREAIDFAEGEQVKAVVSSYQPFLPIGSKKKKSYAAEWWVALSTAATCLHLLAMLKCALKYGSEMPIAVGAAIGITAGFVYLLTFYTGHHFGTGRGKEIAWQEAADAMKKMLGEVKSEIAANEAQS